MAQLRNEQPGAEPPHPPHDSLTLPLQRLLKSRIAFSRPYLHLRNNHCNHPRPRTIVPFLHPPATPPFHHPSNRNNSHVHGNNSMTTMTTKWTGTRPPLKKSHQIFLQLPTTSNQGSIRLQLEYRPHPQAPCFSPLSGAQLNSSLKLAGSVTDWLLHGNHFSTLALPMVALVVGQAQRMEE